MQGTISSHHNNTAQCFSYCSAPGGRVASDRYRQTLAESEDFIGLEEGVNHYQLLLLVKKVGKLGGFTPRMIQLLDYYFAFTRAEDWEEGSRPIVYQSLARTALDLGVTERQIQKLEARLFATGAISWNDSGNHRRYGQRCPRTGRILWAFGVELTPLAYLRADLEVTLEQKRQRDEAWLRTKREISRLRRQVRALLAEWRLAESCSVSEVERYSGRYDEIAIQLRTHLDLGRMQTLLAEHQRLHDELMGAIGVGEVVARSLAQPSGSPCKTAKGSSKSANKFAHYKSTTQPLSEESSRDDACLQESVAASSVPKTTACSGLAHVTIGMATAAASERFRLHLPRQATWGDVIEAAYASRGELGVSQASWAEACELLSRTGAALCLLVTDQASQRASDPVRSPAAYFRGMVNRARAGELQLHRSIFGLLTRRDNAVRDHA